MRTRTVRPATLLPPSQIALLLYLKYQDFSQICSCRKQKTGVFATGLILFSINTFVDQNLTGYYVIICIDLCTIMVHYC